MLGEINRAFRMLLLLIVITGCFYPALVTGIANVFFPHKANGSLLEVQHQIVGSALIGQLFTDSRYFWGRPSVNHYEATLSSGSNLGPSNPIFLNQVEERIKLLHTTTTPPLDLVTASGSGLDPDISVAAALFQIPRIATTRKVSEKELQTLVEKMIIPRRFGFLGEPRVNVLALNLALEGTRPW